MKKNDILNRIEELIVDIDGPYQYTAKGDVDLFTYEIATQANDTYSGTVGLVGEEIVWLALKLYPDASKDTSFKDYP